MNNLNGKTLVLGASENPSRYSYLAAEMLKKHGQEMILVGNKKGEIFGQTILTEWPTGENIHTITFYLSAKNQEKYYDLVLQSGAKRFIFNPGAENQELALLASNKGISTENACTLVLLQTHQFAE